MARILLFALCIVGLIVALINAEPYGVARPITGLQPIQRPYPGPYPAPYDTGIRTPGAPEFSPQFPVTPNLLNGPPSAVVPDVSFQQSIVPPVRPGNNYYPVAIPPPPPAYIPETPIYNYRTIPKPYIPETPSIYPVIPPIPYVINPEIPVYYQTTPAPYVIIPETPNYYQTTPRPYVINPVTPAIPEPASYYPTTPKPEILQSYSSVEQPINSVNPDMSYGDNTYVK